VVAGDDQPALDPGVVAAVAPQPQPDQECGDEEAAHRVVEGTVRAPLAGIAVIALEALGADHLIRARRRGAPLLLTHAYG
jgi:hypothetical protein